VLIPLVLMPLAAVYGDFAGPAVISCNGSLNRRGGALGASDVECTLLAYLWVVDHLGVLVG